MNYKIILDGDELLKFVRWLPELHEGECYYLSLFARKKYHASAKNDKSQCKRSTATSKDWLIKKIRQLEIAEGMYTNKDGTPVHQNALALYVSVNPRSFAVAQTQLLKKLADTVTSDARIMNPAALAMSTIQKAKSRTVYVDFDFDGVSFNEWMKLFLTDKINHDAYTVLETRGGFHLLVEPTKVSDEFKNTWYKALTAIPQCDVAGDNLVPVAGCAQGGFVPRLLNSSFL